MLKRTFYILTLVGLAFVSLQAKSIKKVMTSSETLIPLTSIQNPPRFDFKAFQLQGAVPGKIRVMGPDAFPLLADTDQNAVAAGFIQGKGRGAVFAHPDFMHPKKWSSKAQQQFFEAVHQWVAGKIRFKKVWIQNFKDLVPYYTTKKIPAEEGKTLPLKLSDYSLIILSFGDDAPPLSPEEIQKIQAYVRQGGLLLAWGMGWVWRQYSTSGKNQASLSDYDANRLFEAQGILFSEGYAGNRFDPALFKAEETHTLFTFNKILSLINQPRPLTLAELNELMLWCQNQLTGLSYPNALFSQTQINALKALFARTFQEAAPTESRPITPEQTREVLLMMVMNQMMRGLNPKEALSLFLDFPGEVQKTPEETHEIKLVFSAAHQRWQSTGLYAPPQKTLTVILPANWTSRGLLMRMGVHRDRLFPFSDQIPVWKRWPDLIIEKTLNQTEVRVQSPHGGLITFELPEAHQLPQSETLTLKIRGAVKAPYFKTGVTSLKDWQALLERSQTPFGELEGEKIILSLPVSTLKKIQNPETLIRWWDAVIPLYAELSGEEPHPYKERIVPDRQLSMGYMHSGYPIITHLDVADFSAGIGLSPVEKESLLTQGSWGHFHEMGHNYQKGIYTFEGSGEVVVNLFTLYAMEKITGLAPESHRFLKTRKEKMKQYFESGPSFEKWKKDYALALNTFLILIENLGWEPFKAAFRRFKTLEDQKKTLSDLEKRTQWVVFLSEASGYNLAPYFESWAIPFNPAVKPGLEVLKPFKNPVLP